MISEEYIDYISKVASERTLLEQLAEEASELSQAALKLVRASMLNENFTPIKEDEAIKNLVSELNDVLVVWSVLLKSEYATGLEAIMQTANREKTKKLKRWAKRLGYEE